LASPSLPQVRSKGLLEKDNKKLQEEIERLKKEFENMKDGVQPSPEIMNSILSVRKDSLAKGESRRRKSSVSTVVEEEVVPAEPKTEEVIEEMEELKEEVDEARKLAEEWEAKYKEMQRQMAELEGESCSGRKKSSVAGFERPTLQRGLSTASSGEPRHILQLFPRLLILFFLLIPYRWCWRRGGDGQKSLSQSWW
jgi:chromosome segregation ATPase